MRSVLEAEAVRLGAENMSTLAIDEKGLLVTCQNCGTTNRLAHERLAATVRCGQCKQALSLPPAPLEAENSADFQLLISKASIPIVVDYWAPWCGPCRMVAPQLEKVAARANGRFLIVKVNTDALPDLGERYAIRSIPTLAVFVLGREIARTAGARPADDIEAFVAQSIANAFASKAAH
jgi:thioredoxin 2